jgi:hypothetical protein
VADTKDHRITPLPNHRHHWKRCDLHAKIESGNPTFVELPLASIPTETGCASHELPQQAGGCIACLPASDSEPQTAPRRRTLEKTRKIATTWKRCCNTMHKTGSSRALPPSYHLGSIGSLLGITRHENVSRKLGSSMHARRLILRTALHTEPGASTVTDWTIVSCFWHAT